MAAVEPGAVVQPGQQLARISRTDVYEMRASLPAGSAESLRPGQRIALTSRNLGRDYEGTVHRFAPDLDPATQSVTAFVRVSGKGLRNNLYLEGAIAGEGLEGVVVIPKEALNRDGTVYHIKDGVVAAHPVEVARIDADKAYLRGLPAGLTVITENMAAPIVGQRAR